MSRLAKRPIEIPKATEITVSAGEVRVKGPTVTPGYLKRPDLTKAAFDDE